MSVAKSKYLYSRCKRNYNKKYENREIKDLKSAPKIKKDIPIEKVLKKLNEGYPLSGTTENCTFCTAALVLRKKGYDVRANKTDEGLFEETRKDWYSNYPKSKPFSLKKSEDLFDKFPKDKKDAYGELLVTWKNTGGGHSLYWENTKNGIRIIDGQTGKILSKNYFDKNTSISKYEINDFSDSEPTNRILGAVKTF